MRNRCYVCFFRSLILATIPILVLSGMGGHPVANAAESQEGSPPLIEDLARLSEAYHAVAQRVQPSVVHVSVTRKMPARTYSGSGFGGAEDPMFRRFRWFFEDESPHDRVPLRPAPRRPDPAPRAAGHGSGWVFDRIGHIVTNHHVVKDAHEIVVKFSDRTEMKATLVGSDPKTDIAVIKVDKAPVPPAVVSDRPVRQGEIVFAFGSPFKYEFSMSQGIVSGKGRTMGLLGPGGYESFIQTDAAINPGNSGGPLTNARGQVVGMNTAIASTHGSFAGLGFAIPMDMVRPVVDQLIHGGAVTRGFLGIWISDDKKLLASFGADGGGALIQDVAPEGPAAKAGLKPGDVIVGLDGKPIKQVGVFRNRVAAKAPGTSVKIEVLRNGKKLAIKAVLEKQPGAKEVAQSSMRATDRLAQIGVEAAQAVDAQVAKEFSLDVDEGVLVQRVRPGSLAALAGLRSGCVIQSAMGSAINTPESLGEALKPEALGRGVRLRVVMPEGRSMFILLTEKR